MRKEFESVEWDKQNGSISIIKQQTISINGAENLEEAKQIVRERLRTTVKQIKSLKSAALKDKQLLMKLEGKTGPVKSPVQPPE